MEETTRTMELKLGYGISGDENRSNEDSRGIKLLMGLAGKFSNFVLTRLGNTHAKVLLQRQRIRCYHEFQLVVIER
jgi:hypothetical protein